MDLNHSAAWQCPSNIALVKYWGKYGEQLPANPSLSLTLSKCHTRTVVHFTEAEPAENWRFSVKLDGQEKDDFKPKIETFFNRVLPFFPELNRFEMVIHTTNSFPHSSGIASSASAFAALAMCLTDLRGKIHPFRDRQERLQLASSWARLGSGSASRSIYGGWVLWGRHATIPEGNQDYAVPYPGAVHKLFEDMKDTVLLVEKGQKQVSSSAGHGMMDNHPFAAQRYEAANRHISELAAILAAGDLEAFGTLVEQEALMLHGLMMSGRPGYVLMRPNTLAVIEKVWEFRRNTGVPLFFTLDAGANVHLLFPAGAEQKAMQFVDAELSPYCGSAYIRDEAGPGPQPWNIA